jgi:hypothetical protein
MTEETNTPEDTKSLSRRAMALGVSTGRGVVRVGKWLGPRTIALAKKAGAGVQSTATGANRKLKERRARRDETN